MPRLQHHREAREDGAVKFHGFIGLVGACAGLAVVAVLGGYGEPATVLLVAGIIGALLGCLAGACRTAFTGK